MEDQTSVFMSPSDRVAQLYPEALGSLFVAFYNSQGYDGGILTRLHRGDEIYYVNFCSDDMYHLRMVICHSYLFKRLLFS
jgi:hypothetical protein